jgi:hypothetical protein
VAIAWEVENEKITDGAHRLSDVLRLLANGRTAASIWPD